MTNTLRALRAQIDSIDAAMLRLLNQRATLAHDVGRIKHAEGSVVFRPEREAQVIKTVQQANTGILKNESLACIWREIMSACRALEEAQRVAFLGPVGTFTQEAALRFFGSSMEQVACVNVDEIFHATSSGTAHFGVIPIENSTEGVVTRSLDLLLHSPLHIVGEVSLLIRHNLLRTCESLEGIDVVLAHPQALAQCQQWLNAHLPNAQRRAVSSNAEGARLAASNLAWAAIASERAASEFGLHRLVQGIQDDAFNRTRFVVMCLTSTLSMPDASGKDCTSLVVSVPNRAGAMYDMLVPLKQHGVSMTRFESRPARSGQWDYYFYIDLQGHPSQPHVAAALNDLQGLCAFYKILGAYPIAD